MSNEKNMLGRKKILFLTNIPTPYRIEFWNEWSRYVDLTVVFEKKMEVDRNWIISTREFRFHYIFLKSFTIGKYNHIAFEVLRINFKNYDLVIIGGYSTVTELLSILWCNILNKKIVLSADGGFIRNENCLKAYIKKSLLLRFSFYLSSGRNLTKTLLHYGVDRGKIFEFRFATNTQLLSLLKSKDLNKSFPQFRKNYTLLCIARFVPQKGLEVLLDSWKEFSREYVNADLVLIGDGPEKENYLKKIDKHNIKNIHLIPAMSTDNLVDYYKIADLLILPSMWDPWGLVINEALLFNIPVIATDMVGSAYSLIENGKNGFIFPAGNSNILLNMLITIFQDNAQKLMEMKAYLRQCRYENTIENMVDDHMRALEEMC